MIPTSTDGPLPPVVMVRMAASEVVLPAELVKIALYLLPLSVARAVKLYVGEVAPLMLLQLAPLSALACHWTEGVGLPLAAAVKVAVLRAGTDWSVGWVVTIGANCTVTVKVWVASGLIPLAALKVRI